MDEVLRLHIKLMTEFQGLLSALATPTKQKSLKAVLEPVIKDSETLLVLAPGVVTDKNVVVAIEQLADRCLLLLLNLSRDDLQRHISLLSYLW